MYLYIILYSVLFHINILLENVISKHAKLSHETLDLSDGLVKGTSKHYLHLVHDTVGIALYV